MNLRRETIRPVLGTVVAVADDCAKITEKQVGLMVMYGKFAGTEIALENEEGDEAKFILLSEKELLGYTVD